MALCCCEPPEALTFVLDSSAVVGSGRSGACRAALSAEVTADSARCSGDSQDSRVAKAGCLSHS